MTQPPKHINFTIVPDDTDNAHAARTYANFCAVGHTPFDMTLTFCDVRPLSEHDVKNAQDTQTIRAPVVARLALPFAVVPGLITALQEQLRALQESQAGTAGEGWKGPTH